MCVFSFSRADWDTNMGKYTFSTPSFFISLSKKSEKNKCKLVHCFEKTSNQRNNNDYNCIFLLVWLQLLKKKKKKKDKDKDKVTKPKI